MATIIKNNGIAPRPEVQREALGTTSGGGTAGMQCHPYKVNSNE